MLEPSEDNVEPEVVAEAPAPDPQHMMIDALVFERDQLKDKLLRTMAEAQNVQRRSRAQAETDRKYAAEPLARDLVQVLDNFERTLKAANTGASREGLLEGIQAIDRLFRKVLETHHITQIQGDGVEFDPARHEALTTIESAEHPNDHVVETLESGYALHERVMRPARVKVVKNP